uniref:Putative esophageal gland cell secretory protein 9 n=1 Tax=Meloidogyne incognita TaxID=6306 RepID=Q7YW87_MELIC|nr:putative esophageal gland cell secretory protein 9 [Meloidogyne incognita]
MFLQKQLLFLVVLLLAFSLVKGVTENKNKSEIKNETTTKVIQTSTGGYDDNEKADYGDLAAELAKLVEEEDELNKKKNALSSENGNKNSTGKPYIQKDKSKKYLEEDKGKYEERNSRNKYENSDETHESESGSSSDEDLDEDNLERLPGPSPHNEGISRRRVEKEKGGEDEEEEEKEQENSNDKEERKKKRNTKYNPKDESEEDISFDGQIPKSVRKLLKQLAAGGKNPVIIPLIINNNNIPNRREDESEEWNKKRHGRPHRLNDWNNPFPPFFQSSMFQPPMFQPPMFPPQQPPFGGPPTFAQHLIFLEGLSEEVLLAVFPTQIHFYHN